MAEKFKTIIDVGWLKQRLDNKTMVILDASWHLPSERRNTAEEYEEEHIPGARFFDLDAASDPLSPLPHMAPPAHHFAGYVAKLGVRRSSTIVVYDTGGVHAASRAWWMFKLFGYEKVYVLDGGLQMWKKQGGKLESGKSPVFEVTPEAQPAAEWVIDKQEIHNCMQKKNTLILDARGPGRFSGLEPEPRAGIRSGHIPGSKNLYYRDLLNEDGTFRPVKELKDLFNQRQAKGKNIIATCGSGVTAAIIVQAAVEAGLPMPMLYDGSWSEWGADPRNPIALGDI